MTLHHEGSVLQNLFEYDNVCISVFCFWLFGYCVTLIIKIIRNHSYQHQSCSTCTGMPLILKSSAAYITYT